MRGWFVAQCQQHRESVAEAHLRRQGFDAFVPSYQRTIRHARQFRTKSAPLFPGYLFVAFDPAFDRWRSIRGTHGVVRLVAAGDSPVPLPGGVAEMLGCYSERRKADMRLVEGEPVRLTSGPFAGLMGQLVRLDSKGRVEILLRIMGGDVSVWSEATMLMPAA